MNARETLAEVTDWLRWQDQDLSYGLKNAFDALRLYDHAQANPDLPKMAEEWDSEDLIAAIGYNPFDYVEQARREKSASPTGATAAYAAIEKARKLIDSVAYISTEGDKDQVIAALDDVLVRDQAPDRAQEADDPRWDRAIYR
jgi:hypothetical protein